MEAAAVYQVEGLDHKCSPSYFAGQKVRVSEIWEAPTRLSNPYQDLDLRNLTFNKVNLGLD